MSAPDFAITMSISLRPADVTRICEPIERRLAGSVALALKLSRAPGTGYPELPLGTAFGKLALTLESPTPRWFGFRPRRSNYSRPEQAHTTCNWWGAETR